MLIYTVIQIIELSLKSLPIFLKKMFVPYPSEI